MFSNPRPNVYKSSKGFSLEVLGRTGIHYEEGPRQMFIDSEVLAGPSGIVIYRQSIKGWNPPHNAEEITLAKREEIIENIRKAFQFQGFDIQVI